MTLLLTWPENAPRADSHDGVALVKASEKGHLNIVKELMLAWPWPEDAPRADCNHVIQALAKAAQRGHLDIVVLLTTMMMDGAAKRQ